jgi:ectoine hydroxylase-related dioxygenase (phytanoyl-CoA dioxygenase family)
VYDSEHALAREEYVMSPDAATSSLDATQVAQYHADGFLVVRQVFSAERIAELDAEAQRVLGLTDLIDTNNVRCRWQNHVETGECRFDCFDPVIDLSEACGRAARDPRLLEIVGALYGEPACLFKDKLIFKAPGSLGYNLHQDYIAWKSFPKSFVTAIVAIDPADAGNGATEVFGGYHTQGCLTPPDGMYHQLPDDAVDPAKGRVLELAPGDVAIFSGFTPHRSAPNRSSQSRRLLYLSYNALSDGGEQREQHYAEFRGWLQDRYAEYGRTSTFFR